MALSTDPIKRDCQLVRFKAIKSGMSEDEYKDWLREQFGVSSATELNQKTRKSAHVKLNALLIATGKENKPTGNGWRDPQIEKLMGLWYGLGDMGAVRSVERTAMEAWCKKQQPQLHALRFATVQQLQELIERLKQWQHRLDKAAKAK
jgi:hypothetical protein